MWLKYKVDNFRPAIVQNFRLYFINVFDPVMWCNGLP